MMGLDGVAVPCDPGLYPVRVYGTLNEVLGPHFPCLFLKDPYELLAYDLPLLLRVRDVVKPLEEPLLGLDHDEVDLPAPERCLNFLGLVHPHEAVVNVDSHQPVTQGGASQGGCHTAVHAPAQGDYRFAAAYDGLDLSYGLLHPVQGSPVGLTSADLEHEVSQHLCPVHGVGYLGVPLKAVDFLVLVLHGCHGGPVCVGEYYKVLRRLEHGVAVAHPHLLAGVQPLEYAYRRVDVYLCDAVLSGLVQLSPVHAGQELEPVAEAQHRNA